MTRLDRLYTDYGQSPWLDNLTRGYLRDGTLGLPRGRIGPRGGIHALGAVTGIPTAAGSFRLSRPVGSRPRLHRPSAAENRPFDACGEQPLYRTTVQMLTLIDTTKLPDSTRYPPMLPACTVEAESVGRNLMYTSTLRYWLPSASRITAGSVLAEHR